MRYFQKTFTVLVCLAVLVGINAQPSYVKAVASPTPSVVISEFVPKPTSGVEWVELMNTTDSDIDLAGYSLKDVSNPAKPLSGEIPAHGLFVYTDSTWLNQNEDNLTLIGPGDVQIMSVSYGTTKNNEVAPPFHAEGKPDNDQAVIVGAGSAQYGVATRGWFNDAGNGTIPKLSDIDATLASGVNPIITNLGELTDPTVASGLYFERPGYGKITFTNTLNLTDAGTVTTISLIASKLSFGQGEVSFSPETQSELQKVGAKIEMYNMSGDTYSTSDIVVYDDVGGIISPSDSGYPTISNFVFDNTSNTIIFDTNHFTKYKIIEQVIDNTPPVITLNGSSTVMLVVGDSYVDAGATAVDNIDGDITDNIFVSSTVDTAVAGDYLVQYHVKDAAQNESSVTRSVRVTENPVVTLSEITIIHPADKLKFEVGETLDIAGLVVMGTYSDGSTTTENITSENISGFDSSAVSSSQVLTINVGSKETTYVVEIVSVPDRTAPVVLSVTAAEANGLYRKGQKIKVQVKFSEPVTVTPNHRSGCGMWYGSSCWDAYDYPKLNLEIGTTTRWVDYSDGSGTDTLVFNYVVTDGEVDDDINYASSTALIYNNVDNSIVTIADASGNAANIVLPENSNEKSLAGVKDIAVDGNLRAYVLGVSSDNPDKNYITGDVLTVKVKFSESVNVRAYEWFTCGMWRCSPTYYEYPKLKIRSNTSTEKILNYVDGSGTDTLNFSYTVSAEDESLDLDYFSSSSLYYNTRDNSQVTIKDVVAGNEARIVLAEPGEENSLGYNKNISINQVEKTPPTGYVSDPSIYGEVFGSNLGVSVTTEDQDSYINNVCLKYSDGEVETQIQCMVLSEKDWFSYDYAPSFSFHWDTTAAVDGKYDLYAVMTDNAGNVATTTPIKVTVNNYSLGTAENPASISSCTDLENIDLHLGWHYRLVNDIDCSSVTNFQMIGQFGGELDGQGYSVRNLKINTTNNSGIFSDMDSGSVVKNIKFSGLDITCRSTYCGGLTNVNNGAIERVALSGKMVCNGKCGGFASQNSGLISESYVDLIMVGQEGYGLGLGYAGLFAGHNFSGRIINSYANGSITTSENGGTIGALVGLNERWISYGDIINSYSNAQVSGGVSGGLVGWQYQGSTQSNSYWNVETSGKNEMCGTESYGGSGCNNDNGLTVAQMKVSENFVDWNFEDVWAIKSGLNDGYPYLRDNHDTTAPQYLRAETVKKNQIKVYFDENLDNEALKVGDFKVMDQETEVVINSLNEENGVVTLALSRNLVSYTPDVIINPSTPQSIKDLWGNEQTNTINKVAIDKVDVTAPIINLTGSSTVNLFVGDAYADAGATASDNVDGDITAKISMTGSVNTTAAGTYTLNFDVSDSSDNSAARVSRTVIVTAKTTSGGGSGGGSYGGGSAYTSPIAPIGGFKVSVNNDQKETNTTKSPV